MFRNTYQNGLISLFSAVGSRPLSLWKPHIRNGHLRRLTDEDVHTQVFELTGSNVETAFITSPFCDNESLAIKLPFIAFSIKNLKKYFSLEIQILDDSNCLRRFRLSNYQKTARISIFSTTMPLSLQPGWNEVMLNIAELTRNSYGTNYIETVRVTIHANIRLKHIYFSDRIFEEHEKPQQFRLKKEPAIQKEKLDYGKILKAKHKVVEARPSTPEPEEEKIEPKNEPEEVVPSEAEPTAQETEFEPKTELPTVEEEEEIPPDSSRAEADPATEPEQKTETPMVEEEEGVLPNSSPPEAGPTDPEAEPESKPKLSTVVGEEAIPPDSPSPP